MPFRSERQRRWMWANHPEMAKEWQAHTPEGKLPEKVKQSFAMYQAALTELQKIAATVLQKALTPQQLAQWQAYQGAPSRLPTQVEPAFARSQQLMQKNLEGLPLVGSHGEYYSEALPAHLQAGSKVTPAVETAARQAAKAREATLHQRLMTSGQVYQAPNLEARLQHIPGHSRELTRTGTEAHGGSLVAPSQARSTPVSGHEATQLAGHAPASAVRGSGLRVPAQVGMGHEATQVAKSIPTAVTKAALPARPATAITAVSKVRPGLLGRAGTGIQKLKGIGGKLLRAAA